MAESRKVTSDTGIQPRSCAFERAHKEDVMLQSYYGVTPESKPNLALSTNPDDSVYLLNVGSSHTPVEVSVYAPTFLHCNIVDKGGDAGARIPRTPKKLSTERCFKCKTCNKIFLGNVPVEYILNHMKEHGVKEQTRGRPASKGSSEGAESNYHYGKSPAQTSGSPSMTPRGKPLLSEVVNEVWESDSLTNSDAVKDLIVQPGAESQSPDGTMVKILLSPSADVDTVLIYYPYEQHVFNTFLEHDIDTASTIEIQKFQDVSSSPKQNRNFPHQSIVRRMVVSQLESQTAPKNTPPKKHSHNYGMGDSQSAAESPNQKESEGSFRCELCDETFPPNASGLYILNHMIEHGIVKSERGHPDQVHGSKDISVRKDIQCGRRLQKPLVDMCAMQRQHGDANKSHLNADTESYIGSPVSFRAMPLKDTGQPLRLETKALQVMTSSALSVQSDVNLSLVTQSDFESGSVVIANVDSSLLTSSGMTTILLAESDTNNSSFVESGVAVNPTYPEVDILSKDLSSTSLDLIKHEEGISSEALMESEDSAEPSSHFDTHGSYVDTVLRSQTGNQETGRSKNWCSPRRGSHKKKRGPGRPRKTKTPCAVDSKALKNKPKRKCTGVGLEPLGPNFAAQWDKSDSLTLSEGHSASKVGENAVTYSYANTSLAVQLYGEKPSETKIFPDTKTESPIGNDDKTRIETVHEVTDATLKIRPNSDSDADTHVAEELEFQTEVLKKCVGRPKKKCISNSRRGIHRTVHTFEPSDYENTSGETEKGNHVTRLAALYCEDVNVDLSLNVQRDMLSPKTEQESNVSPNSNHISTPQTRYEPEVSLNSNPEIGHQSGQEPIISPKSNTEEDGTTDLIQSHFDSDSDDCLDEEHASKSGYFKEYTESSKERFKKGQSRPKSADMFELTRSQIVMDTSSCSNGLKSSEHKSHEADLPVRSLRVNLTSISWHEETGISSPLTHDLSQEFNSGIHGDEEPKITKQRVGRPKKKRFPNSQLGKSKTMQRFLSTDSVAVNSDIKCSSGVTRSRAKSQEEDSSEKELHNLKSNTLKQSHNDKNIFSEPSLKFKTSLDVHLTADDPEMPVPEPGKSIASLTESQTDDLVTVGSNTPSEINSPINTVIMKSLKPHQCDICGKSFPYSNGMLRHRRLHSGEKRFKCSKCSSAFAEKCNLQKHLETHSKIYSCNICDYSCNNDLQFRTHQNEHYTGKLYGPCKNCGSTFQSGSSVKYHIVRNHPGEPACQCSKCEQMFLTEELCWEHTFQHFIKNQVSPCSQCGITFKECKCSKEHQVKHNNDSKSANEATVEPEQKLESVSISPQNSTIKETHKKRKPSCKSTTVICNICGKLLLKSSLDRHTTGFHKSLKPHQCDICGKSFPYSNGMLRHRRLHSGEKRFKCSKCSSAFAEKCNLQKHLETHSKIYSCNICDYSCNNDLQFRTHQNEHYTGKLYGPCKNCGSTFRSRSSLKYHIVRNHPGEPACQCSKCEQIFLTEELCREHASQHFIKNQESLCSQCGKVFKQCKCSKEHLVKHNNDSESANEATVEPEQKLESVSISPQNSTIKVTHKKRKPSCKSTTVICNICGKLLLKSSLDRHITGFHKSLKPHQCDICGKSFPYSNGMLRHRRLHSGEKRFKCSKCSSAFAEKCNLQKHLETHSKIYSCNICDYSCNNDLQFRTHQNEHYTGKLYGPCKNCGSTFRSRSSLKYHIVRNHPGEPACQCSKCEQIFLTEELCREHSRTCQEQRRISVKSEAAVSLFPCNQCEKTFKHKKSLRVHLLKHSNTYNFSCEVCGKLFLSRGNLREHVRCVHEKVRPKKNMHCDMCPYSCFLRKALQNHKDKQHSTTKRFKCPCGNCFAVEDDLKIHLRQHTGERPYKCEYCDKAYARRSALWRHQSDNHAKPRVHKCNKCGKEFRTYQLMYQHKTLTHSNARPHKCSLCNLAFKRPYNLRIHQRVHTGEKPFKCNDCGKGLGSSTAMKKHIVWHQKVALKRMKKTLSGKIKAKGKTVSKRSQKRGVKKQSVKEKHQKEV